MNGGGVTRRPDRRSRVDAQVAVQQDAIPLMAGQGEDVGDTVVGSRDQRRWSGQRGAPEHGHPHIGVERPAHEDQPHDGVGPAPCAPCRAGLLPPPALPRPPGIDRLAVVFAYDGSGRRLVTRLKYGNARSSLAWLAAALAQIAIGPAQERPHVVTWVPT